MSENTTKWRKDELEAYLLFYCANADFVETEEEKIFIHSRVSDEVYSKIHLEFIKDKDYTRIQKIIEAAERLELSKKEVNTLFKEIESLFNADGKYTILEKEIFIGLRRVLK
jgi:hypothetical protein